MTARHAVTLALVSLVATAGAAVAQGPKAQPKKEQSPAAAAVVAQERSIYEALVKKDFAAFNKALGTDFVYVDPTGAMHWELAKSAETLKACTTGKWAMDNVETHPVGNDIMVLTYKASGEQTCDGKKQPSPMLAMSVWRRQGDRWVAVAHSETTPAPGK